MADQTHEVDTAAQSADRPAYSPPRVIIYTEEELLRQLGPAKACDRFYPGDPITMDTFPPGGKPFRRA